MNIVKLQNQLKSVPVETLIKYVQGMNPEVPSYLALAEIKNRKDMEARYASQNQQAPEKSVAEDLTQAPQSSGLEMLAKNPQLSPGAPSSQGVADLPVPDDMYQDQNFAAGGIVAFGPGGDVASKRYQAALEDSYFSPGSIYAGAKDLLGMPFQYGWTVDPATGKLVRKKDIEGFTPNLDAYRKAAELRKQGLLAEADTLEKAASSPKVDKRGLASIDTAPVDTGMTFSREDIANMEPYRKTAAPRMDTMPTKPTEDITKPMPGPAVAPKDAGINSLLEDTEGLAEKRMERYRKMVGEDPERANLEKLIKKYETGAGEQERMAPWMALAKAGFTMAGGKSPFAIQNLSEGAVAGLADYAQAKDRLDKLTERQIDIRTKMQQAKRAEDIAAATYGLNSEAAVEARNAQVKLKDMEEKNAFARTKYSADVSTKNAMIAAAKKSDYETFMDLAKQDEDNYKTVKDKDGTVRKVFDVNKVTQIYKSYGGPSSATDKELIESYEKQAMLDPTFVKKYPTPADFVKSQRAILSGTSTGVDSSASSSQWGPLKVK